MMRGALICLALAGIAAPPARAQFADPTRPAGAAAAVGGDVAAAAAEGGVQTVILRPGGKSAAVINGQYVALGGRLGDKRVVKISESEVVLKGESGREVLKVTPAIEKTPVRKTGTKDK